MENINHEIPISNTSLAAYLKSEGFELLIIEYRPTRFKGRQQGTFIFKANNPKIHEYISAFNRCDATGNIVQYQMAREDLVDRVMRGLP